MAARASGYFDWRPNDDDDVAVATDETILRGAPRRLIIILTATGEKERGIGSPAFNTWCR